MFTHSELPRSSRLSRSLRNSLLCAGLTLAAAGSVYTVPAHANLQDVFNEFDYPPLDPATNTYGPNALELDFTGNVCPNIPAQYVQDKGIDPFYALEIYEIDNGGPVVTPTFTCTFDGSITHAQWAGGTLPVPLPAGWPVTLHKDDNGNLDVHSGFDEGGPSLTGIVPIYKKWIWTQTNPAQSMIIPITAALASRLGVEKKPFYAALFIATGTKGTSETGTWYLLSYQGTPEFTLSNNGPELITLPSGKSGILTGIAGPTEEQCEETPNCYETLLDELNDQGYPEPGMEGSPFIQIKVPSQLNPGQTYTFKAPK
jgi:hypothetical protein